MTTSFYVVKAHDYGGLDGEENPAPVYLLLIKYYNAQGKLINEQFVNNGQDAIHQHFFTVENVKELMSGKDVNQKPNTPDYIDYKYTDTTPWDKNSEVRQCQNSQVLPTPLALRELCCS